MKLSVVPVALSLLLLHSSAFAVSPLEIKQERYAAAAARPAILNGDAVFAGIDFTYKPLVGAHPIQDENFYLLTLFEQIPEALAALDDDGELRAIRRAVIARAKDAAAACEREIGDDIYRGTGKSIGEQPACTAEAMRWTAAQRQRSATALGRLYDRSLAIKRIVTEHMRPSGRFQRDVGLDDRALLLKAWADALEGVDRIIRVYALGEKPRYADIDSPIYPDKPGYYRRLVTRALWGAARKADKLPAAWQVSVEYSLGLLEINRSATDYVGHAYGTEGAEMCIQLANLDTTLGTLFDVLDKSGVDYVVGLAADHGGNDIP